MKQLMRFRSVPASPATGRPRSARLAAGLVAVVAALVTGCRESAPDDLILSEDTTEALVFVKTTGEETLNRSRIDGNLYRLSPISPDGIVTPLTTFAGAAVSDPCVSFDGERILFSMRPPGASDRNIWEIGADGSGLRQITRGGGDDFDPLYLPNGHILFTSSRANEMDEYNHAPAEHLHLCEADGSGVERISFNQSDDFDPTLMPDGRIVYTRWEHFGTMNRFPLFFTNPDGAKTFHKYGPHSRNFFHPQPTPDGRIIAIESRRVNEDAGPIAILKLEAGPADPVLVDTEHHWNVLTPQVDGEGAPWPHGAFKYPFPLGNNRYVVSYTLPAATEEETDYGLYTFTLQQQGNGTDDDPATISVADLTFLYNDPAANEYDAQLLAARPTPPVVAPLVDRSKTSGVFLASDVFNRSDRDGQETPDRGVDPIDEIAVFVGIPTMRGERNDFSANEFEKRALLGFAPVYADGSFRIEVPADVPISFATLDEHRRAFVTKRTWIYVRPGEVTDECTGCHKDRGLSEEHITNPNPIARNMVPTDLNVGPDSYTFINYENDIGPIVEAKCAPCHFTKYFERKVVLPDGTVASTVPDSIPAPADLDLSSLPEIDDRDRTFPRGYFNLSGEPLEGAPNVVVPAFPRRSVLIDAILGLDSRAAEGPHPDLASPNALTAQERELFNLWVSLGAQYR